MKPLSVISLCLLLLSGCHKESVTKPGTAVSNVASTTGRLAVNNSFGVIVNASDDITLTPTKEINVARQINALYIRHALILSNYSGREPYQDSIKADGFKAVTNFNWVPVGLGPSPFLTSAQLGLYATTLGNALTKYPPSLVVIENEETNMNYHTGSTQQYINMLNAAIPVAHIRGLKITNGGLIGAVINILVWKNYLATGQAVKADDFAHRAFPPALYNVLPYIPAQLALKVAKTDSLLAAYTTMPLDYINFHWYADTRQDGSSVYIPSIDTAHLDTKSLKELVDYLKLRTGKAIVTNEIGESYFSSGYVTDIMQAALDMKLPYCIWYSGDGDRRFEATALHNGSGDLRPSGTAYRAFMQAHF